MLSHISNRPRVAYLVLATLIYMGSDVGQIFPTASLHRDHSISYALVCEKEISYMGKNNGNRDLVCEKSISHNSQSANAYWCKYLTIPKVQMLTGANSSQFPKFKCLLVKISHNSQSANAYLCNTKIIVWCVSLYGRKSWITF